MLSATKAMLAVGRRSLGVDVSEKRGLDLVLMDESRKLQALMRTVQPHLPHLKPCACGETDCHELTNAEFKPGHAAKRKARLWRYARTGRDAVEELKRRRWDLPSEFK